MGGLLRGDGQRRHAGMQVGHYGTQPAQAGEAQERGGGVGRALVGPGVRVGPAQGDQLGAPGRDGEDGLGFSLFHQAADNRQAVSGKGVMRGRDAQSLDVTISLPRILMIRVPAG